MYRHHMLTPNFQCLMVRLRYLLRRLKTDGAVGTPLLSEPFGPRHRDCYAISRAFLLLALGRLYTNKIPMVNQSLHVTKDRLRFSLAPEHSEQLRY